MLNSLRLLPRRFTYSAAAAAFHSSAITMTGPILDNGEAAANLKTGHNKVVIIGSGQSLRHARGKLLLPQPPVSSDPVCRRLRA